MQLKAETKLLITIPALAALIALDSISALEGVPLLIITLGVALLIGDSVRLWLKAKARPNLAMLPFMGAALVVLLAFCKGRNLSQLVLLLITLAVVFDILLIALAVIAEVAKRRERGLLEFFALLAAGVAAGFVLSLVFVLLHGPPAGTSLAGP